MGQKLLLSIFIFVISQNTFAENGQLNIKTGTWSFQTENVRSTSDSISGFGAYSIEFGYSFFDQVLFVFGFNLIMSDIISGSTGYGFDIGAKYYPLSDIGTTQVENSNVSLTVQERWRPYIGGFIRQRLFGLAISTSYMGPGLSIGIDYSISRRVFLNAEFRYDLLFGPGESTAQQTNFLVGAGIEF